VDIFQAKAQKLKQLVNIVEKILLKNKNLIVSIDPSNID